MPTVRMLLSVLKIRLSKKSDGFRGPSYDGFVFEYTFCSESRTNILGISAVKKLTLF
jgi:hypothetical protein